MIDQAAVEQVLRDNRDACMRSFSDGARWWTLLVTAPYGNLVAWGLEAWPEFFDARGETQRVRFHFLASVPVELEMQTLVAAIAAAERHDVTVQLLLSHGPVEATRRRHELGGGVSVSVADMREEYPVLHLATHRRGWFKPDGIAPQQERPDE